MYFFRTSRQLKTSTRLSLHIHHCLVWIRHQTAQEQTRTVRTAEKIIVANLPSIQDLHISRVRKQAGHIAEDSSHAGHNLFQLLPSGAVGATELCTPKIPKTRTVSPHRLSLWGTLHRVSNTNTTNFHYRLDFFQFKMQHVLTCTYHYAHVSINPACSLVYRHVHTHILYICT